MGEKATNEDETAFTILPLLLTELVFFKSSDLSEFQLFTKETCLTGPSLAVGPAAGGCRGYNKSVGKKLYCRPAIRYLESKSDQRGICWVVNKCLTFVVYIEPEIC